MTNGGLFGGVLKLPDEDPRANHPRAVRNVEEEPNDYAFDDASDNAPATIGNSSSRSVRTSNQSTSS